MSYNTDFRKPLRSRTQQLPSGKFIRKLKTKPTKSRPTWDDSVNDLKVFKPSSQELKRNHELHLPKKDHERLLQRIATAKSLAEQEETVADESSFFFGNSKKSTVAAIKRKEILRKQGFYDQDREINELLSETDKTIAEAQDIFGDAIYKYKSIPAFTKAPNFTGDVVNCNLSTFVSDNVTYFDTLSESIVRELNPSIESDEEENEDRNYEKYSTNYYNETFKSKINVDHYQNILSQNIEENVPSKIDIPDIQSLSDELTKSMKSDEINKSAKKVDELSTGIVTEITQSNNPAKKNVASSALQTFDDMKKMLDALESEIEEYEKETGREITSKPKIPSSISGYTAHLIYIILRLTNHLKQSETQLKAEMAMRTEILDMFDDQRQLVDVLTNNLMELEEQNDTLKKELECQKISCENNHAKLKRDVESLENVFNQGFAKLNNHEKYLERKPLGDMSNTLGMSWVEED